MFGEHDELDWSAAAGAATAFADGIALMTAIFYLAINARDAMTDGGKLIVAIASDVPAQQSNRRDDAAVRAGHVVITITLLASVLSTCDPAELFRDLGAARGCIAPFGGLIEIIDETKGEVSVGIRLRR